MLEALKDGFVKIVILTCIVLGLPGVGKTHLKFLLLDQEPPHLRTSTYCAESPIRIEIKTITGTKMQTIGGKWHDVEDDEMFDVVAEMILLAEPESSEQLKDVDVALEQSEEPRPSTGVFSRIKNWLMKSTPSPGTAAQSISSDVSDACQKAMNVIMEKLTLCITKARGRSEATETSQSLRKLDLKSKWVYFNDSGGQPEYHELLPLFVRNISSVLCVIRLPDKLDRTQAVEYFKDGQRVGDIQRSQFTAKDTVKCLVNTMQAYSTQEQPPNIIVVGTHLDMLEKKPLQASGHEAASLPISSGGLPGSDIETLEDKDRQLLEMLEADCGSQLVYYSKSEDTKKLIFPLNALKPGEHDKTVAGLIRHSVENSDAREVKIPIWWYILELLLQELAKELGRGVLSKAECLQMARLLNISVDSFNAALVFFDELNIIKYSPNVLPDVIFIDSQIPLDKVSELVYHSYLLRQPVAAVPALPMTLQMEQFRDQGVVSKECLKTFDRHYVQGIFSEDDLVEFLKQRLVLAPIPVPKLKADSKEPLSTSSCQQNSSTGEEKETHFVMPTLLRTLTNAELESCRFTSPIAATLLVRFPRGHRRSGVFCCFIVHLIRHCGWDLLLETKEPLYRNCIKLRLLTSPPTTVVLIDSDTYIEVHVNTTTRIPISEYADLLPVIKQAILSGTFAACRALNYKQTKPQLTFYCPHMAATATAEGSKGEEQHTATLTPDRKYWRCDLNPDTYFGVLEQQHTIWFGMSQGILLIYTHFVQSLFINFLYNPALYSERDVLKQETVKMTSKCSPLGVFNLVYANPV